jgi:hypothetical protein
LPVLLSGVYLYLNQSCCQKSLSRLLQDGYTPLIKAAWNGNAEAVQALLDAGADIKVLDTVRGRHVTT